MAVSLLKVGVRVAVFNVEKTASCLVVPNKNTWLGKRFIHTKQDGCTGSFCLLSYNKPQPRQAAPPTLTELVREYSKGRHDRKRESDSESDSDAECKGNERSEFWRRKMRTVHNLLDIDKDGLISYSDFSLFAQRFTEIGHLTPREAEEFRKIIKMSWEEQWGAVDPYNLITVEQYLEDMRHVLSDKTLKKKAHRWLPYLFQAVDKDKSGFISVEEFKMFFQCLGLNNEQAAVSFAIIDTNADGVLSLKEFVKLGKDYFNTEDERRVSRMFWGPLVDH